MSWPGFHALSAAWLFLLVPLLVALYFLKLKRPALRVPSLALWEAVMQDKRVNSPFQRFKRNLLLWLQLAVLLLLILATMLPFVRGAGSSDRVLIMIDQSASMAARDAAGSPTRLELAKERAREVIEGLSPSQSAAIIAFEQSARQVVAFTNSHRVLLDGLSRLRVVEVGSDATDALRMADAMARSNPFDRVLMFTDGNIPGAVDFDPPFKLELERVGKPAPNVGITSLHARRDGGHGWSVFVRVQGSPGAEVPCDLTVEQDGEGVFKEAVHLGREGGQRFVFPIAASGTTQLRFRLECRAFDALPVDNEAWLVLEEARDLRVLVERKLAFFAHAMKVIDNVAIDEEPQAGTTYDLVVAARAEGIPQALTALHVGYVPDDLGSILSVTDLDSEGEGVTDWQRNSALLEHVELNELVILQRVVWQQGMGESDVDSQRYSVLVHGGRGPLVVAKEDGGLIRYHLLFDPGRSTLPYRVGFPILCRNLVDIAMQRAGLLEVQGSRTGVLPPLPLKPDTGYEIRGPETSHQERTGPGGLLTGIASPRAGIYRIKGGGGEFAVGASLLAAAETELGAVDRLEMNEIRVDAAAGPVATDQSLWGVLAAIALAVSMVEWWFFHRRPGGFRAGGAGVRPGGAR